MYFGAKTDEKPSGNASFIGHLNHVATSMHDFRLLKRLPGIQFWISYYGYPTNIADGPVFDILP